MRDRFPDGDLYVNLRRFDPIAEPLEAADALVSFLIALGVQTERMPQELDARAGLFRILVHGKQMLILLDNARTAEQVRPLLPGTSSCLALGRSRAALPVTTSRPELTGNKHSRSSRNSMMPRPMLFDKNWIRNGNCVEVAVGVSAPGCGTQRIGPVVS
ncbi:hypothetical protein [Saccharopolyspora spinosa]|uniref:hypothetical protein n=1 Tax=Saccharopolyspora spinosa TaxID=60894 RepID=UPI001ED982BC|nr:hypothetical protein [Saccharopolyspora spinosa]